MNLWSVDVSTLYTLWSRVPSYTVIGSSNFANETPYTSTTLVEVTCSDIENRYVVFWLLPTQTRPGRRLKKRGVLSFVAPRFTSSIVIVAVAAVFERGT